MIKLFDFQKKIFEDSKKFKNVAYYLDMGLGKTFVGSERLKYNNNDVNLLVCQKSKINDWINHFNEYYKFDVYDLSKIKEYREFINYIKQSTNELKKYYPIIGVINYEMAWRRQDLLDMRDFTLMLDESSIIQNHKSHLTKFQMNLKNISKNIILLSGTPTDGKYENLYTQLKMLGTDLTKWNYDQKYMNWEIRKMGHYHFPVLKKKDPYKNVEELKKLFRDKGSFFVKTNEVIDLPNQRFIKLQVARDTKYIKFIKDWVVETNNKDFIGDSELNKRLYSRMLCGSYSKPKMNAIKDLIESTTDRLIIFYNFKDEFNALDEMIFKMKRPCSVVNGDKHDLNAYDICDNSITLIQYQAGAMGLNLQKCNKVIYFTLPERSMFFEQSKKRIHRVGQTEPCTYWVLETQKSIEVQILNTLKKRKNYTDELFKEGLNKM